MVRMNTEHTASGRAVSLFVPGEMCRNRNMELPCRSHNDVGAVDCVSRNAACCFVERPVWKYI